MTRGHVEIMERVFQARTTICREPRGRKEPDRSEGMTQPARLHRDGQQDQQERDGWRGRHGLVHLSDSQPRLPAGITEKVFKEIPKAGSHLGPITSDSLVVGPGLWNFTKVP